MSFRCLVRLQLKMENPHVIVFKREAMVEFFFDRSGARFSRLRLGRDRAHKQGGYQKDTGFHSLRPQDFLGRAYLIGAR